MIGPRTRDLTIETARATESEIENEIGTTTGIAGIAIGTTTGIDDLGEMTATASGTVVGTGTGTGTAEAERTIEM